MRPTLCWCVWQKSTFSRCEDVFTFNLFIYRFYKFWIANEMCKDKAVMKLCSCYIKKRFTSVNFDWSYYVSIVIMSHSGITKRTSHDIAIF
jgi:hypothetical protein